MQNYKINILTIIKMEEKANMFGNKTMVKKVQGVVSGNTKIEEGDILLLFGHIKDLRTVLSMD
jgi:trk system potassium uptake protein TrkA